MDKFAVYVAPNGAIPNSCDGFYKDYAPYGASIRRMGGKPITQHQVCAKDRFSSRKRLSNRLRPLLASLLIAK